MVLVTYKLYALLGWKENVRKDLTLALNSIYIDNKYFCFILMEWHSSNIAMSYNYAINQATESWIGLKICTFYNSISRLSLCFYINCLLILISWQLAKNVYSFTGLQQAINDRVCKIRVIHKTIGVIDLILLKLCDN